MRLLLDTHSFLWWVADKPELPTKARRVITNPENECFVSLASCWEIAIKTSIGKLKLPTPIERFIPEQFSLNSFSPLEVQFNHIVHVAHLPFHHRDPFDRLLAAQAIEEEMAIVSADAIFKRYGVKRVW